MSQENTRKNEAAKVCSQEVAELAYLLWEKDGRNHGKDVEYWLLAEAQLADLQKKQGAKSGASKVTPASTAKPAGKSKTQPQYA